MNKKKKILYVITKSVWGGAQKYVHDLAAHLAPEQFDVAVACGGSGPLIARLKEAGIRSIPIMSLQRNVDVIKELASFFSLIKIFIREKPGIIHLNSSKVGGLGAVAARLASLVTGSRPLVIFTVHGWGFNEDRPYWQRTAIFFFSWLSAIFLDKLILISSADYRSARRFVPERKLILIQNGIGPIAFLPREEARHFFGERLGREFRPDEIIIGTNAELTKNKGHIQLIDAVNQMEIQNPKSKIQTIIVGEGEERKKLQNRIRSLELEDTVHLVGFVPEAARYLKALDVFVLPSLKEGLPYTLMEAMAAGVPVIATGVGGIPDLIENGKSGMLVPPKDPNALAQALLAFLARPERGRTLARKAGERLENDFRLDAMIARTQSLYA